MGNPHKGAKDLIIRHNELKENYQKLELANKKLTEQLRIAVVSKRCLSDIEIEYSHPSGKKKGKLMYDDDEYQTLMLKYDGGFINLPNIEDCNVC